MRTIKPAHLYRLTRRSFGASFVAAGLSTLVPRGGAQPNAWESGTAGRVLSFKPPRPGGDHTAALQALLDQLTQEGGGTLRLLADCRAGILVLRGENITLDGQGHNLQGARIVVHPQARRFTIRDLTLRNTTGRHDSYALDISGQSGRIADVTLEKTPMAGGYQAYVRQEAQGCVFQRLTLRGSNGVFVAGRDHLFEDFDFTSTLRRDVGGDDAFAIKGAGAVTQNITIRRGVVRGFAAAISIGSEVGSSSDHPRPGAVRQVAVSQIEADRCQMLCFIKPGALIYDWYRGLVEDVMLDDMRLSDPAGFLFARGVAISAARGATVRRITGRNLRISARASTRGVMPTAAVDIVVRSNLPEATIEDVDLDVIYDGSGSNGYSVDQIARIEKDDPDIGTIRNITLALTGSHTRIAGVSIGPNLDNPVTIARADFREIGLDPPAVAGAAGIWADSPVIIRQARIGVRDVPPCGGRAASALGRGLCRTES